MLESTADRLSVGLKLFHEQFGAPRALVAAGGVAANQAIRGALQDVAAKAETTLIIPPPALCTDNGAMIAWAGAERLALGLTDTMDAPPRARWLLDANATRAGGLCEYARGILDERDCTMPPFTIPVALSSAPAPGARRWPASPRARRARGHALRARSPRSAAEIAATRENPKLPGVQLAPRHRRDQRSRACRTRRHHPRRDARAALARGGDSAGAASRARQHR